MKIQITLDTSNEDEIKEVIRSLGTLAGIDGSEPSEPADETNDRPAPKKGKAKPAPEPEEEEDEKPAPKKGKAKPAPEPEPAEEDEEDEDTLSLREEFRTAMKALKAAKGMPECDKILTQFDAEVLTDVDADDLPLAIKRAKKAAG
jgi:outer membrane biosynthesis protein TonB